MKIDFSGSKIKSEKKANSVLATELKALQVASKKGYSTNYASINLPVEKEFKLESSKLASKLKTAEVLIVVGIGGSNLGTIAVQEAVQGKLHNETKLPRVYYADTVDTNSILDILELMEQTLKRKKNIVINAISKSGGTTETIANFQAILTVFKKHREDYSDWVVITSTKESKFWKFAKKHKFHTLKIPEKVGGRYSVFSNVGLFPLALMGLDITGLLKGAEKARKECLLPIAKNPAASSAIHIYHHSKNGINIVDHFMFSTNLESVGKWYRQLMGESIGKEFSKTKNSVHAGITPTVSIGSTDLHSMAQLYLGGPHDKYSIIVTADTVHQLTINKSKEFAKLLPLIQGKKFSTIMDAIAKGTMTALKKGKRPYSRIHLENHSAESIGEFLQFKMFEIIFLAALMNVNPFDQPAVEKYKTETKKVLK